MESFLNFQLEILRPQVLSEGYNYKLPAVQYILPEQNLLKYPLQLNAYSSLNKIRDTRFIEGGNDQASLYNRFLETINSIGRLLITMKEKKSWFHKIL